jgi:serine O-acetyltransferase
MHRLTGPYAKLRADLRRYVEASPHRSALLVCLFDRGFHFVASFRVQEMLLGVPVVGKLARRVLWYLTSIWYGAEIAMGAQIGGGLYVPHPFGIIIGKPARIGSGVTIMQGATIGQKSFDDPRNPVIGDGAVIEQGAVVVGGLTLSAGTTVSPKRVVTHDL